MPNEIYEVVSQAARYWFLFLMVLIVWRSYRWLARDRRQSRKRLKLLPDAGYVGEMVVVHGSEELSPGMALPVTVEGVLGSSRGDDLYVPVHGVHKKHLWFEYDEEAGVLVHPFAGCRAEVDGIPLLGRRAQGCLSHGSRLTVGEAELRLRLFAGFETTGSAALAGSDTQTDSEAQLVPQAQPMPEGMVAFTPQQLAAYQQMQWLSAWQAAQMQQAQAWQAAQMQQAMANGAVSGMAEASGAGASPIPTSGMDAVAAGPVLNTPHGDFVPPPKMRAGQAILPQEEGMAEVVAAPSGSKPEKPSDMPEGGLGRAPRRFRNAPLPSPYDDSPTENGARAFTDPPVDNDDAAYPTFAPEGEADAYWAQMHAREHRDAELRLSAQDDSYTQPETGNATFAPRVTFYPPVVDGPSMDGAEASDAEEGESYPQAGASEPGAKAAWPSETSDAGAEWPYAPYPQSNARFADGGFTYPEYVEPEGNEPYEYADEDEAPRSLYVEPDEAEKAKQLLWDRYLKGGRRR